MWLLVAGASSAATIYRWVDPQGITHYSDQPHEGAQKLTLQGAQTYAADNAPSSPARPARDETPAAAAPQCAIESPANDQMFMNAWSVSGRVQVNPPAPPGARFSVLLDGKPLTAGVDSNGSFTIDPIDRGTHTLAAIVEKGDGEMLCRAPAITFHVHQPSVQAPNPVTRPHF